MVAQLGLLSVGRPGPDPDHHHRSVIGWAALEGTPMLAPVSEDTKIIAVALAEILVSVAGSTAYIDDVPFVDDDKSNFLIDGTINLDRLAVRLVQLFYGHS